MRIDPEIKDAFAEFFIWNILILAIPLLFVVSVLWQAKEILFNANFTS